MHDILPFRFSDLPPELRDLSYSFTVVACSPRFTCCHREPVLALVSRPLGRECLDVYYKQNTWATVSNEHQHLPGHNLRTSLVRFGISNIARIRQLHLITSKRDGYRPITCSIDLTG